MGASERSLNPNGGVMPSKQQRGLPKENFMDYRPVVRERIDGLAHAARALAAAFAVVACVAGGPAHAADKAAPAADATVTTTVPPSTSVDAPPAASSADKVDT